MSMKRTSVESNNDDETKKDSGCDDVKRSRLDLPSDTMLQDLPKELLEDILVKAVAMEVKGLRLAKSVWNEKADLVISRLRTVSSQWSNILTTDCFRQRIHITLDDTAAPVLRLEVLHESRVKSEIHQTTASKDEIFLFWKVPDCIYHVILVHNRNNILEVKDVISPPADQDFVCIAACNVSNCLYAGIYTWNQDPNYYSIARISKTTAEQQFSVSPWITDHRFEIIMLSVSTNGDLIIHSHIEEGEQRVLTIHNADGSLQREIMLSPEFGTFCIRNVIQKSNGNLVLAYVRYHKDDIFRPAPIRVMEIDTSGDVVRKYVSSLADDSRVDSADTYGRILITENSGRMELLDSEFNLLGTYRLPQDQGKRLRVWVSNYSSERNEIVRIHLDTLDRVTNGLTIIRLTEE